MRNSRSWLLVGQTVRVTCWPSRRARDCLLTWRASAARRGPTSSRRSWGFIPAACAFISSGCAPLGWSLASACRRRSGGRGTAGRSPPTRFRPASHAMPTLVSRAGWRAASRRARDGCARWSVPDGSSDASSSRPAAAARPRSRWAGRSPPWASLLSVQPATAGRVLFRLGNCPYREAVRENQPVVCALHRGLTRGLLDQLDPAARLADFVPKDPDRAGCLIEVEGFERA